MPLPGQLIILTPGFPKDEQDTTCITALQQFLLALRRADPAQEVAVIAFQYPYDAGEYRWHGCKVFALGGANHSQARRLWTWWKAWQRLRRLRAQNRIAGVLSLWLGECALVGRYFCRAHQLKHFIWMQGQDAKADNRYVRRIKPDGNQILAISDFLKRELHRNFGLAAGQVVNNGINEDAFPQLNTGHRPYDIIGVGSLIPLKNYAAFVEVVRQLKTDHPNLTAAIAGEGPERANLTAQIEALGLKSQITLLGQLPHAEALRLMNQARIFLHPSIYEGNASVLIEALFAGCRVVSFCGLAEAKVENLWLCRDPEDLLTTVRQLLAAPHPPVKRVLFNRMEDSVRKILGLYR